MFSSNNTPDQEYAYARELGATINLDAFEDIEHLERAAGIPEIISCRYNPGGVFELGTDIMDNPGEAKFGMTKEQLFEAFAILKEREQKLWDSFLPSFQYCYSSLLSRIGAPAFCIGCRNQGKVRYFAGLHQSFWRNRC